jgi:holo-[acyl-carrier protein] synthase
MMIVAVGTDIVSIDRIKQSLERHGEAFIKRIYSTGERQQAKQRNTGEARFFATRFAAKEAIWKALNRERKENIALPDIEILADDKGAPVVHLHKSALIAADKKAGKTWKMDLSLSDDAGMALAFVVFSAR